MTELQVLTDQISQVEHFSGLPLADLKAIVSMGQVINLEKGRRVFIEGDPCAGMYVLLKGKIDLYKAGPQGQSSIISSLIPVIMFNEVPVLDSGPNTVTAVAAVNSILWFISCDRFQYLLTRYHQVAMGLLRIMAKRNRLLISNYSDVSFRTVTMRIAMHLLMISENGAVAITRSQHPIKGMAAWVVTSPECVSRTLKLLSSRKMIEVNRKSIRVIDPLELQKLAQSTY